jgi:hypothetical protein
MQHIWGVLRVLTSILLFCLLVQRGVERHRLKESAPRLSVGLRLEFFLSINLGTSLAITNPASCCHGL